MFAMKFGKKAEEVITDSQARTADALFHNLESIALAVEVLTAVTSTLLRTIACPRKMHSRHQGEVTSDQIRSPKLRCCVCHIHHEQALKAPYRVRQFFKTVLRQVHNNRVDVIAGDATAAAYRYYKRQEEQDLHNSSVAVMLREMQREVNTGRRYACRLHIDYHTNQLSFSQLSSADDLDCCFMAMLSWRKTAWTQNCEKTLEEHAWAHPE